MVFKKGASPMSNRSADPTRSPAPMASKLPGGQKVGSLPMGQQKQGPMPVQQRKNNAMPGGWAKQAQLAGNKKAKG